MGVSTPFTGAPGDVAAEGEEGRESDANDLETPDRTGGRGARYLSLAGCDSGETDCVVGEDGFDVGVPDGSGAAWDLIDLGLGDRGFSGDDPSLAGGLRVTEGGCGWGEGSAGGL